MKRFLAILCVLACLCALCLPAAAFGEYTVRVKAPAGWKDVYLYMWNSMDMVPNAEWPGVKLTNKNDGWYEVALSNVAYDRVIISNGSGQTEDIEVDMMYDLWITVDTGFNYGVAYVEEEAGKVDFGPKFMSVVGMNIPGVGEWSTDDPAGIMEEVEDLVYVKTIGLAAGTTMTFKFTGNGTWDLPFNMGYASAGQAVALNKSLELTENGQDMTFTATKDMGLKIILNLTAMENGGKATFKLEEVDGVDIPEPPAPVEKDYFVAGEEGLCGTAWDCAAEANKMVSQGNGIYTLTFNNISAGTYKLKVTDGTWTNSWGDPNSGDPDGNFVLNVAEAGNVVITFNDGTKTVSAEVVANPPEVTEPEVTEPEVTEPEVTEPEVTEPEVTEPEVTEPEVTEPEVTEPEVTEPEATEPSAAPSEPEATEPSAAPSEPEGTQAPSQPAANNSSDKSEDKGGNGMLIAIVIGIWVVAAALIIFLIIKKL